MLVQRAMRNQLAQSARLSILPIEQMFTLWNVGRSHSRFHRFTTTGWEERSTEEISNSAFDVKSVDLRFSPRQFFQIPTLNLLRTNHSDLTFEHWNLISSLVRCYDEQRVSMSIQTFIDEQKNLPPKLRYKSAALEKIFTLMLSGVQIFFESNEDFRSLASNDRSVLLRNAAETVGTFAGLCVCRQANLLDDDVIVRLTKKSYGPVVMHSVRRLIDFIDQDWTLIKLGVAMFAFSTVNSLASSRVRMERLDDLSTVLRVQNSYAEATWRYLLYRSDHRHAVCCFTNHIRCFLLTITTIVEAHRVEQHTLMVDTLLDELHRTLTNVPSPLF